MGEKDFMENVLGKNVQSMIFIFKRTIKNDMKLFLHWFKNEIEINPNFREIYSPLVRGTLLCHGQFLS